MQTFYIRNREISLDILSLLVFLQPGGLYFFFFFYCKIINEKVFNTHVCYTYLGENVNVEVVESFNECSF